MGCASIAAPRGHARRRARPSVPVGVEALQPLAGLRARRAQRDRAEQRRAQLPQIIGGCARAGCARPACGAARRAGPAPARADRARSAITRRSSSVGAGVRPRELQHARTRSRGCCRRATRRAQIAAITFTNKAGRDARAGKALVGARRRPLVVSTFHSLGVRCCAGRRARGPEAAVQHPRQRRRAPASCGRRRQFR